MAMKSAKKLFVDSNHETPTMSRLQIERRMLAFHAVDSNDISGRFRLMLGDALGKRNDMSDNGILLSPWH